jgi:glutamate N-acetyltransferase/amino-acid N-acetyltransferase
LSDLCLELAQAMAADGEGATRMFTVEVKGARTKKEADQVARRVANSPLIKTAFHAADPNWGRGMMAVGSAGVRLDPEGVDVDFVSGPARAAVVRNGGRSRSYCESRARAILEKKEFTVLINLHQGPASRRIFTCDFSPDYVRINASYRT